jgi:hypothetical protein
VLSLTIILLLLLVVLVLGADSTFASQRPRWCAFTANRGVNAGRV